METLKYLVKKYTSRKFLLALGGVVSGILVMSGYSNTSAETISGAILTLGSAIGYIVAEFKLDKANIDKVVEATNAVETIVETVKTESK